MAAVQFYIPYDIMVKPGNLGTPNGTLYVYATGTLNPLPIYATSALTTQLSNPVVADGAGRLPPIYLNNSLAYRIRAFDKDGGLLLDRDPYIPGSAPDAAALAPYQAACEAAAEAAALDAANVAAVLGHIANIDAVAADLTNINAVQADLTALNAVSADLTNLNLVAADIANLHALALDLTALNAVQADLSNINAVAGDLTNLNLVAGGITAINTVATNIAGVNTTATNIAAILDAPNQAAIATTQAAVATSAATNLNPNVRLLSGAEFGLTDTAGNAVPLASSAGYQYSFSLQDCDTIPVFGDSLIEGPAFNLQDKSILSRVSNFAAYRFINMGLSGDTTTGIAERIVDNRKTVVAGSSWNFSILGMTAHGAKNARFAMLMSWANENPTSWRQNAPKILELFKSNGAQPVLVSEAENNTTYEWSQQTELQNLARQYHADYIDVRFIKDELATPSTSINPMWVSVHPGTRASMIYAAPLIEWAKNLPRPRRSIKIYKARSFLTIGSVADLVFDTIESMVAKFTEISVGHKFIPTANQDWFQEFDKHTVPGSLMQDQYNVLANGQQLTLTDYTLVRIALPAQARSLDGVALQVGTNATEAYVLDKYASNTSNTDTPMGAWVQQTIANGLITIKRNELARSMRSNELFVLLHKTGGVTLARPIVHYSGREATEPEPRVVRTYGNEGAELLTTQTTAALTGWTTQGSPATVVPFDLGWGCPRIPNTTNPITGVTEITSANTIGQAYALSASNKDWVYYRLRVWARYWPKVYLDNSLSGYGFPAGQVLDRSAGAVFTDNAIHGDSFDFQTLRLQTAVHAAGVVTPNAYEKQDQLVGLYWTPIDFIIPIAKAAHQATATLNFNLSCPDGTLQIGRVSMREVQQYVDRC